MESVCRKTKFSTEEFANYYIKKLERTSLRHESPIRAYLCQKCGSWHLTKRKEYLDWQTKTIIDLQSQVSKLSIQNNALHLALNSLVGEKTKHELLTKFYENENKIHPEKRNESKKGASVKSPKKQKTTN